MRKRAFKKQRKKLNNAGVSLVELLVAMSILVIVSVVIYQGLVQGARLNGKSRTQHKATSLAQNTMEALKAEDVTTILRQFSGSEAFTILPTQIRPDATGGYGVMGEYLDPTGADGYKKYFVQGGTEQRMEKYYLYVDDAVMDGAKFDMLITLNGSPYLEETNAESRGKSYNMSETILAPSMDANYDAIISNSVEYDADALAEIERMVGVGFVKEQVKRVITVDIDSIDMYNPEYPTAHVIDVTYDYYYGGEATPKASYIDSKIFDNQANVQYQLRNIFLFFRPSYGRGIGWRDEIVVNNPENQEIPLYLIKQQDRTNLTEVKIAEASYNVCFQLNETAVPGRTNSFMTLHTNLGTNLADSGLSTFAREEYWYNTTPLLTQDAVKSTLGRENLTHGEVQDHIFDVEVTVFASDGTATATLGNTAYVSDPATVKAGFTGKQLAEITGSIQNK